MIFEQLFPRRKANRDAKAKQEAEVYKPIVPRCPQCGGVRPKVKATKTCCSRKCMALFRAELGDCLGTSAERRAHKAHLERMRTEYDELAL